MAETDPVRDPDDTGTGTGTGTDDETTTGRGLGERAARTWTNALLRAGSWADRMDAVVPRSTGTDDDPGPGDPAIDPASGLESDDLDSSALSGDASMAEPGEPGDDTTADDPFRSGRTASVWAVTKAAVGLLGAPVAVPTMTVAALRTARITSARIEAFPDHLHALAEDREPPLPGHRTVRRPSGQRYLITSDLHRCIPGRLDWPERQRVKGLYLDVLEDYAADGWHLIENGDVEDFWMVGGSAWGTVYDVAYLTGSAARGPNRDDQRRTILTEQLDRIVSNNRDIYRMLSEAFCADGRYSRTMGNHDDAYTDSFMAEYLGHHLPGAEVADTILLTPDGSGPDDGISGVDAIIAHGHLTDSWNGPGFAPLGRTITWMITGLDDLPAIPKVDGLPDEEGLGRLLGGKARNRLISVDPRYGGNRRFDSMDEERLFARLAEDEPDGGWPWIIYGHTHFPMLWPQNRAGSAVKYANSGCGVLEGAFSALEWDSSDPERPLSLVVWSRGEDAPRRHELVPDGPTFLPVDRSA